MSIKSRVAIFFVTNVFFFGGYRTNQIYYYYCRSKKKSDLGKPEVDKIELVSSEEEVGRSTPPLVVPGMSIEDSDSDTDSIPDISQEKGLRFHLKKKSKFNFCFLVYLLMVLNNLNQLRK